MVFVSFGLVCSGYGGLVVVLVVLLVVFVCCGVSGLWVR